MSNPAGPLAILPARKADSSHLFAKFTQNVNTNNTYLTFKFAIIKNYLENFYLLISTLLKLELNVIVTYRACDTGFFSSGTAAQRGL
jgi:hypothetical protein